MIEPIPDMPAGTIGFRASGHVTRDEYRDVLVPALRDAVESGEVRLMFVIDAGFEEMEAGALLEDAKTGLNLGFGHGSAWKRTAIVTDVDWIRRAVHMFAWMTPGEIMACELGQEAEARAWVAA
jgi:hypothetical protein